MSLMRVRRPQLPERWLRCAFPVLGGESSFVMLHVACEVTAQVEAWSLLSNYASQVTGGKYRSPVAPAPPQTLLAASSLRTLSVKEAEVLECIGDGLSSKRIGQQLSLSEHTVRNHTKRIFSKLGVHSRVEAIMVLNAAAPR